MGPYLTSILFLGSLQKTMLLITSLSLFRVRYKLTSFSCAFDSAFLSGFFSSSMEIVFVRLTGDSDDDEDSSSPSITGMADSSSLNVFICISEMWESILLRVII